MLSLADVPAHGVSSGQDAIMPIVGKLVRHPARRIKGQEDLDGAAIDAEVARSRPVR